MKGTLLLVNVATTISLLTSPIVAGQQDQPQATETQGRTTFRSAVDVVSISAVVRDRKGRFVPNLDKRDFVVADGGEPRPIVDFKAQADGPVKLALLVDISGSMRMGSKAVDARQAALHLFSALRPTDQAAVFTFDTRLDHVTNFTSDVSALEAALDHVMPPYGQTSMYDAVDETARAVGAAGPGHGEIPQRSAVVVLTDGIDTKSRLTPAQVAAVASGIDIPVYIIAVMSPIDDPRESESGRSEVSGGLESLARWTGGELFLSSAPAHASLAARQIVDELRHQYRLAFEASTKPGWRPLEVHARDRELTVRARSGYTVGGVNSTLTFDKAQASPCALSKAQC
jgi:VWFA-related protein